MSSHSQILRDAVKVFVDTDAGGISVLKVTYWADITHMMTRMSFAIFKGINFDDKDSILYHPPHTHEGCDVNILEIADKIEKDTTDMVALHYISFSCPGVKEYHKEYVTAEEAKTNHLGLV